MYVTRLGIASVKAELLNLSPTRMTFSAARFLTPDVTASLPGLFERVFGTPSRSDLAENPSAYHMHLAEPLAALLRTSVFVTIGYVGMGKRLPFYYHTDTDLEAMLAGELPAIAGHNFHTWLSLGSGEILDFVLGSVGTPLYADSLVDDIIAGPADELAYGLTYHPTLIGTAFLQRIDALDALSLPGAVASSNARGSICRP